ncbi:hypothetical protein MPSEU_000179600 [Mayamaea pseudoterrestris]|nr:hypothetical protein MPSEU_000179600 [Mayamaea pseudoterrestris]
MMKATNFDDSINSIRQLVMRTTGHQYLTPARRRRKKFLAQSASISKNARICWLCLSFLSTSLCHASSKKEPQWSFLTDNLGSLYVSEDEDEERILAALADISPDDELYDDLSEYSSDYTETIDKQSKPIPKRRPLKAAVKEKQPTSKLSYVNLPETYRAVAPAAPIQPATDPTTTLKSTPPKTIMTTPPPTNMVLMHPATSSMSPWIQRFLASCQNDALLPLPLDFLLDNFNLAQLAPVVERIALHACSEQERLLVLQTLDASQQYPIYRRALELLVEQQQDEHGDNGSQDATIPPPLERATRALYLLLHQRFCQSPRGLDMVRRRIVVARDNASTAFGHCPNASCRNMPLLPVGLDDNYQLLQLANNETSTRKHFYCKRYCCNCKRVFVLKSNKVDGCAWGRSFCHLFVMTFGKQFLQSSRVRPNRQQIENVVDQQQQQQQQQQAKQTHMHGKAAQATIFGFRLHPTAGQ